MKEYHRLVVVERDLNVQISPAATCTSRNACYIDLPKSSKLQDFVKDNLRALDFISYWVSCKINEESLDHFSFGLIRRELNEKKLWEKTKRYVKHIVGQIRKKLFHG